MKKILVLSGMFLLSAWSTGASALCQIQPGWLNRVFNFSFPASLSVADNLPVGSVLATSSISLPTDTIYNCFFVTAFTNAVGSYSGRAIDSSGVMATNVPGIGTRTTVIEPTGSRVVPYSGSSPTSPLGVAAIAFVPPSTVVMDLIKTGPVTGGAVDSGFYIGMKGPDSNWYAIYNLPAKINIVRVGCTVTNAAISVPMGNVSRTAFSGVGPSSVVSNFSIPLSCIAGTRVSVTINGTADPSNITGVLALNASAQTVASGIGLQVLNNNVPVTLGAPMLISTVGIDGPLTIPLTGRYYQTAPQVSPGVANSTATFTLTYN